MDLADKTSEREEKGEREARRWEMFFWVPMSAFFRSVGERV